MRNLRSDFVRLHSILCSAQRVQRKLLYVCLSSYVVVYGVIRRIVLFKLLQLVHQRGGESHGLVRFGMKSFVEDLVDDMVFACTH